MPVDVADIIRLKCRTCRSIKYHCFKSIAEAKANIVMQDFSIYDASNHCHYANMSMQYAAIVKGCKNGILDEKRERDIFYFSLFFAQKIDYGYRLALNEVILTCTHNLCFRAK